MFIAFSVKKKTLVNSLIMFIAFSAKKTTTGNSLIMFIAFRVKKRKKKPAAKSLYSLRDGAYTLT